MVVDSGRFAVTLLTTICCGVIGSYLRRRQQQKALRQLRSVTLAIQIPNPDQAHSIPPQPPGLGMYPLPGLPQAGAAPSNAPPPSRIVYSAFSPPTYDEVTDKEQKVSELPPSYQEAIRAQGGYSNPSVVSDEGDQGPSTRHELTTISRTVDHLTQHDSTNNPHRNADIA
ncbi:hypothetical protein LSH36_839g04030 [Paralvinella palmiformis]|uniref:Uncharacterized protein n=1 Tax=Paralvinella palmiformis TaxID=53620 RepID=A0AAD9IZV3_9ANNE|nr:hypothetical protein LSH36_839g04030 [Paralvinella palmiformis]